MAWAFLIALICLIGELVHRRLQRQQDARLPGERTTHLVDIRRKTRRRWRRRR